MYIAPNEANGFSSTFTIGYTNRLCGYPVVDGLVGWRKWTGAFPNLGPQTKKLNYCLNNVASRGWERFVCSSSAHLPRPYVHTPTLIFSNALCVAR